MGRDWERGVVTEGRRFSVEDRCLQNEEKRFRECIVYRMCVCLCPTLGSPDLSVS